MPALQQMLAQYNEAQVAYVKASIRLLEGLGYTVTGPQAEGARSYPIAGGVAVVQ